MADQLVRARVSKRLVAWTVSICIITVLAFLTLPHLLIIKSTPRWDRAKMNLHVIMLALERYATDNGSYPWDISALSEQGYLPVFPENEYSSRGAQEQQRMQWIEPGHPSRPGDFTYLKLVGTIDGVEHVIGYELYLYGRQMDIKDYPKLRNV